MNLDELKKLSFEQLFKRWKDALFPFERAGCGNCLTQHASFRELLDCGHTGISDQVATLGAMPVNDGREPIELTMGRYLSENLDALYAMRIFFQNIYHPLTNWAIPTDAAVEEKPEEVLV